MKAPSDVTSPDRNKVVPVLLSGGSGSRLWPISRESLPKQFWPLISDRSLIEETARRALGEGFASPIVVCNHEHRFLVAEEMRRAGVHSPRIVLEPIGRNSAPAIAAAALLVAEQDPDTVLWMMAADAAIGDVPALHNALAAAVTAARIGRIVTFGMRPTSAETGYGYIEVGRQLPDVPGVHELVRFIEKPDHASAAVMVASGLHLWNSGMFVFTARTLLTELEKHAPDVLSALRPAVSGRTEDQDFIRLEPEAFAQAPNISLDYAVAERTERAAVVPADIEWSDVGSWAALWELALKDVAGNVAVGDVLLESAENCYVRSENVVTAVVGLRDVVVVATEDAVLAMHRDRAQDVKKIVERLRASRRREAVAHNRVDQPWGFHKDLGGGEHFQVKCFVVSPQQTVPLQTQLRTVGHWVVVNGIALVTCDSTTRLLHENESVLLPRGSAYGFRNPGQIPLTLIEVTGGLDDDADKLTGAAGSASNTHIL